MRFKPSLPLTLTLLVLAAGFARLGLWQLERQGEKSDLYARFENAPELDIDTALKRQETFARVNATGTFDVRRHILADNRIHKGRAGVHVLTPFRLEDGRLLLVNRGWLPLPPDRRSLPEVNTRPDRQGIRGILVPPPGKGPQLGEADRLDPDRWPQLATYPDREAIAAALGEPLLPWTIQLDRDDPNGFAGRDWRAAVMPPQTHGAYALQWFSLAIAAVVIWLLLGFRRAAAETPERKRPNET
jgi:surfeit locus 1 family protein